LEFRQLQSLIAIHRAGSFAQAAENLGYAQPTLTAHIQALERELNVKLFDRLGHRIRLTRDGERFIGYAERILKLSDEAVASVGEKATGGKIIIGVSETFSVLRLPALLRKFRSKHPDIAIELKFGDLARFYEDLKNNVIDLAVILVAKVPYASLVAEILYPEPLALIAAIDHPLGGQSKLKPSDFAGETFIVTREGCAYRDFLENIFKDRAINPQAFMQVKNIEAIKQFTISGLGVALLPKVYVEKEIEQNLLTELSWGGPAFGMFTEVVYHKDKWLTTPLLSFLEMLHSD
jgi:Transcriptional regulator